MLQMSASLLYYCILYALSHTWSRDEARRICRLRWTTAGNLTLTKLDPRLRMVVQTATDLLQVMLYSVDAFPDRQAHLKVAFVAEVLESAIERLGNKVHPAIIDRYENDKQWVSDLGTIVRLHFLSSFATLMLLLRQLETRISVYRGYFKSAAEKYAIAYFKLGHHSPELVDKLLDELRYIYPGKLAVTSKVSDYFG